MTAMRDAFTQFRVGITFDREFNSSTSKTTTAAALQPALPRAMDALATPRSMSYAELKQLPTHNTIELSGFASRITLTTYMDLLKRQESNLQIAVQIITYGRLGFSRVWDRGFRVTTQGAYRDLEEKELYEYHDEFAETARTESAGALSNGSERRVANGSFCIVFKFARAIVRSSHHFGIYRRLSRSSGIV